MTALSAGMHVGDSALGLGYPIYLWIIFGNGFRFGVEYLKRATVLAVVGFGFMALNTPVWIRDRDLAVGLLIGLIALPVYVSVLIRKLSEAKQQAEEASKAKSMFLASVSHELRTPLNAIISFADLLRLGRLEREQAEMATVIGDSGRSLLGLINNILDFSRIEAGKQPVRIAPFDLAACLDQVRRVLSVQAQAKGVFVHVWIGPGLPLRLIGPEQELKQVLLNLGGNAVKFTSHGGVTICVRKGEGADGGLMLKVDVIDTGIGIAPEAQGRIFDAFAQADDSIIDSYGGTGLGLAIVRQLVRRHGGEVSLSSEPGKGSTFSFTMGVSEGTARGEAEARRAAVIVSHHPALGVQFGRYGARPEWVTNVAAARDALAAGVDSERSQLLVFDRETMSEAAFGNMAAVLDELHVSIAVGVMSETPDDHERTAGFPLTISMSARATEEDWRRLAAVGEVSAPTAASAGGQAPASKARSLRILVAEDNRTNQEVARRLLERAGHQVEIAAQGEEAVEMLERQTFDLVLMDINMPVMNGYEATKLHRFASLGRRHVPIYALTADVTPETRERSREAGMQGCLHKPIDMAELQAVLDAVGGAAQPDNGKARPRLRRRHRRSFRLRPTKPRPSTPSRWSMRAPCAGWRSWEGPPSYRSWPRSSSPTRGARSTNSTTRPPCMTRRRSAT